MHGLGAIEKGQTFFCFQHNRLQTRFTERLRASHSLAIIKSFPFPDQRQGQMG